MNLDSSISLPRTLENGFASGLTYLQFCVRLNERATLLCYTQIASSRNRKHCESLSQNFANVVFMVHNFLRIVVIFCLRMRKRLCYEAQVTNESLNQLSPGRLGSVMMMTSQDGLSYQEAHEDK